jgi:hypothetical protein
MTVSIAPTRFTWSPDPSDSDIAWVIQLFRHREQLRWAAQFLRRHYPRSRVVIISDGDGEDYQDIADEYTFDYVRGAHLMLLETSHEYMVRMLRTLVAGNETYLFKIDPDTRVWRRFRNCPAFTCLFGTLETVSEGQRDEIAVPANVQGGCIGMTRDAAEAMLDSDLLSPRYLVDSYAQTWARCHDMVRAAAQGKCCEDFIISWVAHQLGIPIVESPEIRSRWRRTPRNDDGRYAITHPHKLSVPRERPSFAPAPSDRVDAQAQ